MATEQELRAFMRRRHMVRFERRFEPGSITGYVVGVSSDLCMLLYIDGAIRFDGFQVFRSRDIRKLRVEPNATFKATALMRRRDRRPVKPQLRLADFRQVIRSAGRCFPLVTIHREQVDPGVCQIGAVVDVGDRRVVLREIRPDGTWMHRAAAYALREITRVDFGGAYEHALHVVGGRPPRANETQQPTGAPSGAGG